MDPRFLRWPIISPNTYVLQRHRQTEYCQCWMKQRKRLQVKYGNEWVWANDKDIRLRIRSSYQRYSVKKRDVKNFVKFTEKHRGLPSNFTKNEARLQVFSCEFCEIFRDTILKEHLLDTRASWNSDEKYHE